MQETFQSVLIGGAAGFLSAIVTHFSTRAKLRLDLAAEYDKKLQENRMEAYIKLWGMLEPLARYGADDVSRAVIKSISKQTRAWYFQVGGIYLTQRSRKPYFKWKESMQSLLEGTKHGGNEEAVIPSEQLNRTLEAGSTLRTALSDDIGTKRLSRL